MSTTIRIATIEDMTSVLEIVNHEILHSTSIWDYDIRTLEQQISILEEKKKAKLLVLEPTAHSDLKLVTNLQSNIQFTFMKIFMEME